MGTLAELLIKLKNASTKEYSAILENIKNIVSSQDLSDELNQMSFSELIELMIVLDPNTLSTFIEKYMDIIKKKISEGTPEDFGRLYEGLPKTQRKVVSRFLREYITRKLSQFSLRDVIKMIYSVVPATREIVLNQYKEIMMRPDFQKLIMSDLPAFAEFLSVLPESIRRQVINRHKNFFVSDEFVKKLKELNSDDRANILRWFPIDLAKEIVRRMKNV